MYALMWRYAKPYGRWRVLMTNHSRKVLDEYKRKMDKERSARPVEYRVAQTGK